MENKSGKWAGAFSLLVALSGPAAVADGIAGAPYSGQRYAMPGTAYAPPPAQQRRVAPRPRQPKQEDPPTFSIGALGGAGLLMESASSMIPMISAGAQIGYVLVPHFEIDAIFRYDTFPLGLTGSGFGFLNFLGGFKGRVSNDRGFWIGISGGYDLLNSTTSGVTTSSAALEIDNGIGYDIPLGSSLSLGIQIDASFYPLSGVGMYLHGLTSFKIWF